MVNHNRAAKNRQLREVRAAEVAAWIIVQEVPGPSEAEKARRAAEDQDIAARRAEIPLH